MIRRAVSDDAPQAIPLILEAIGSIAYVLTGTEILADAMAILERFFQEKDNRVSYENTLVLEELDASVEDRRILGIAISALTRMGLVHKFPTIRVELTMHWILNACIIALIGAALGAIYPAFKAAQKDPIDALAYE